MYPTLDGFDHIHVYVANREAAAAWYEEFLGFTVNQTLAIWADNPNGPLTIEDASGKIHLALFSREEFIPSTAVAFKTDGENFLAWKAQLEDNGLLDRITDHTLAWSLYFKDLDGNLNEITTYEYHFVSKQLK